MSRTLDLRHFLYRGLRLTVALLLVASAVVYFGMQLGNLLDRDDSGQVETPLIRALASQLTEGPGVLYGPYSGENPRVLIHAPLYYRLAGLWAWPLKSAGLDPLDAALVAGRGLALVAALGLMVLVYRLARLDGAGRSAGFAAVVLVAASPVLGCLSVTVRPDAMAAALQTLGVVLVLRALRKGSPQAGDLMIAYAAFALAFCAKQHSLVAPAVSTALLMGAWTRGRVSWRPILLAHGLAVTIVALDLAIEEGITGRMMIRSVFVLPGGPFRAINYGAWSHLGWVAGIVAKKSIGLLALAGACVWAEWRRSARREDAKAAIPGPNPSPQRGRVPFSDKQEGLSSHPEVRGVGILACLRADLGASFSSSERSRSFRSLDAAFLLYLAAELAALVPLSIFNSGAADNYALQAIVFACLLVGRALGRVVEARPDAAKLAGVAAAAAVLLVADARLAFINVRDRLADRVHLRSMLTDREVAACPNECRYFTRHQRLNRLHGQVELAHDEWLYGAFELALAAEPRTVWLRAALTIGPIRQVITPVEDETVPGLPEPLTALGYRPLARFGHYQVWERGGGSARLALGAAQGASRRHNGAKEE
jgi:hypothetical protein